MTLRGRVHNGVVVLETPDLLPEGAEVEVIHVSTESAPAAPGSTIGQRMMKFAGTVQGLPSDAARNHDHYLYGTPKK